MIEKFYLCVFLSSPVCVFCYPPLFVHLSPAGYQDTGTPGHQDTGTRGTGAWDTGAWGQRMGLVSENRDFSRTEHSVDLRTVSKLEFVCCGPVENAQSALSVWA